MPAAGYDIGLSSSSSFANQFGAFNAGNKTGLPWYAVVAILAVILFGVMIFRRK